MLVPVGLLYDYADMLETTGRDASAVRSVADSLAQTECRSVDLAGVKARLRSAMDGERRIRASATNSPIVQQIAGGRARAYRDALLLIELLGHTEQESMDEAWVIFAADGDVCGAESTKSMAILASAEMDAERPHHAPHIPRRFVDQGGRK